MSEVIKCEKCGSELWSDDVDEIEHWKELERHGVLLCPICNGNMRFVNEKMGVIA
ncbi:MAG: hypothetical protein J7K61_03125 [Thermoplasmata archaeon]|nr:hypothetical protein [Thermoplasmata archaeon]